MHTTRIQADNKNFVFIHNGDYSGETIIRELNKYDDVVQFIIVPSEVLFKYAANMVRDNTITELEGMDWKELLGIGRA